jgi:thymidine kinase
MLSNHNQEMIPCSWFEKLGDIDITMVTNADVILVNEGQFFEDLYEVVKKWVEIEGKDVVVAGLDGDSNRNKFGQMLDLIPIADKVKKLNSFCMICKYSKKAPFTMRCTDQKEQVLIGSDCYKPVCRLCYCYFDENPDAK